jgi:hypothetical protein
MDVRCGEMVWAGRRAGKTLAMRDWSGVGEERVAAAVGEMEDEDEEAIRKVRVR